MAQAGVGCNGIGLCVTARTGFTLLKPIPKSVFQYLNCALAIHQWITDVKILGQTRHRIINRSVTMGVEITHGITADLRRFQKTTRGRQSQSRHRVQNSAMYGFQTIAGIWQQNPMSSGSPLCQIS